ncbi:MAG: UDP-N-acetylglucosamine 2-epimerase (non-hydrolyzing) [Candidatus Omnitrophica bacterium]|nr:UDP-N-acetylglucosamine 2-epimerase (non-hydrolyzing) [Candidatus Omnitrophota bacterium]
MRIICVVGARPNFVKFAALWHEIKKYPEFEVTVVHTGQHYDDNMSAVFFRDLELSEPDYNLGISGGTATFQVSNIMREFERVIVIEKPDMVMVFGDVNSTLAAALVAAQYGIPLAHIEAGLRSGDMRMKEEINRKLTDHLSDVLFVTEDSGYENLVFENIDERKIHLVGNIMVDALLTMRQKAVKSRVLEDNNLTKYGYTLVTLHRAETIENSEYLRIIMETLEEITKTKYVLFPVHPHTLKKIGRELKAIGDGSPGLVCISPLGYNDFICALDNAYAVLTDSGGVQTEACVLGIPCITMRTVTEHKSTVEYGNVVTGIDKSSILHAFNNLNNKRADLPLTWDGKTAERIVSILKRMANQKASAA